MRYAMTTADCVREIAVYCLRRRKSCFEGWPAPVVFKYFAFHFLAHTICVAREGRAILGVGIAYSGPESYFREREGKPFDWQLPVAGETLYVADIVSSKRGVPRLWWWGMWKHPWIKKILTYRRGKLVELSKATLDRLAKMEAA